MYSRISLYVLFIALFFSKQGYAQQTKQELTAKMANNTCATIQEKLKDKPASSLTKAYVNEVLMQSMMAVVGKEMTAIQQLYGQDAFQDADLMRTLGQQVGAQLIQDCPSFATLIASIASNESSSATTGQTVGKLGELRGTSLAILSLTVNQTENADFLWLSRFQGAEQLLSKLSTLKGRQVRVSWREIDAYRPETKRYQKLREITDLELL